MYNNKDSRSDKDNKRYDVVIEQGYRKYSDFND
ncbi:Protein of unknown function [Bacillus mobilis]|nr:Protein of unknown function [Bacillus mobilis]